MDIVESYAEILVGLVLLVAASFLLFTNVLDPAFEQIEINYNARADKAATFSTTLNEGLGVHDQHVGRTPGIDPPVGFYDRNDSGMSRMYFRPEQFVLLPAVDTDVASNPNLPLGQRKVVVSSNYDVVGTPKNAQEHRGLVIGQDSFTFDLDYTITRDALYDKQITYDSINTQGLYSTVKGLAVFPSHTFGTQAQGNKINHGGFNLTVDSTIDPISKKISNSVIFVTGRVPTK